MLLKLMKLLNLKKNFSHRNFLELQASSINDLQFDTSKQELMNALLGMKHGLNSSAEKSKCTVICKSIVPR